MAVTIKLKHGLTPDAENWLAKNIGPRLHYLHNSIGGQGWLAKYGWREGMVHKYWELTFEDERYASFFLVKFPQ